MWSLPIGTVFQGINVTILFAIVAVLGYWVKGMPERGRVRNEAALLTAKIEEDLRGEAAVRFKEFRAEVHALRNELGAISSELRQSEARSMRRGDKLNMVLFILRLVMDELRAKDPNNKVLGQARKLLERVEDEPPAEDNSDALNSAVDTVDNAQATVRAVKASEALNKGEDK